MTRQRAEPFRPVRAAVLAGSVVPPAYGVAIAVLAIADGRKAGALQVWHDLPVVLAFGWPLAWAVALAWGLPMIVWLRRRGWLSPWALAAWGAVGGWIVAVTLGQLQQGALVPLRLSPPGGASLGAVSGLIAWWSVRSRRSAAGVGTTTPR